MFEHFFTFRSSDPENKLDTGEISTLRYSGWVETVKIIEPATICGKKLDVI